MMAIAKEILLDRATSIIRSYRQGATRRNYVAEM